MKKPIRTDVEYETALEEIDSLFDVDEGTPEMDRLDLLMILVEAYEGEHYQIPLPDPIAAIRYHIETTGITQSKFAEMVGIPPGRVSELLSKTRELSKDHIRRINNVTNIPLEVLFQSYEVISPNKRIAA